MNYITVELQTTDDTTAILTTVKSNINEAEQQYHTILASAAVSAVPLHSACMINERGQFIKYELFDHREVENNMDDE